MTEKGKRTTGNCISSLSGRGKTRFPSSFRRRPLRVNSLCRSGLERRTERTATVIPSATSQLTTPNSCPIRCLMSGRPRSCGPMPIIQPRWTRPVTERLCGLRKLLPRGEKRGRPSSLSIPASCSWRGKSIASAWMSSPSFRLLLRSASTTVIQRRVSAQCTV